MPQRLIAVTSIRNKTKHTYTVQKNKPKFTAVNIGIGIRHWHFSPKYQNIGHQKFYANRLTLQLLVVLMQQISCHRWVFWWETGQSMRYRGGHMCHTGSHRDLAPSSLCVEYASVKYHPCDCPQIKTHSTNKQTDGQTDREMHSNTSNKLINTVQTSWTFLVTMQTRFPVLFPAVLSTLASLPVPSSQDTIAYFLQLFFTELSSCMLSCIVYCWNFS